MAYELFANTPATTVASGGTDAPASGTVETWTVASSAEFPTAATSVSQFHVGDPAATSEMIAVTNVSGSTWTVTRGAESTTPVAHSAGFTVQQVVTAGALGSFAQAGFGDLGGSGDAATVTSTHLSAALPVNQGGTGEETQQAALNNLAGGVTSGDYLRGNGSNVLLSAIQAADVPVLNQNTSGTAAAVSGTVAIANGGTGQGTQQGALNSLAGTVTAGDYLRGDGTNVSMSVIHAGDVPVLNQNTTGTAGGLSSTLVIGSGGTGQTTQQAALNALAGGTTSAQYLRGNGTNVVLSAIQVSDVPTLNQNTSGTASNITDTLDQVPAPAANVSLNSHKITSLANGTAAQDGAAFGQIPTSAAGIGGLLAANNLTDVASRTTAFANISPTTTLGDIIYENSTPAPARLAGNSATQEMFLSQAGNGTVSAAPAWSVVSGMYLTIPTSYAPGTQVSLNVVGTVPAALSSASVNTGPFTAPSSTTVVVTVSMVAGIVPAGQMAFGLSAHGTASSIFGNWSVFGDSTAALTPRAYCIPFVVTGLVANTPYNFDLVAAATANGTVSVLALGETSPGSLGGAFRGAPVTMTVRAV